MERYYSLGLREETYLYFFEDLKAFDELVLARTGAYYSRNTKKNDFKGQIKKTAYQIFYDRHKIRVDCQYDESNKMTALICNKKQEVRKGRKLKDRSQYPLYLVVPELNLKLHMDLGANGDVFELYINSFGFYLHTYLYDNDHKSDK